MSGGRPSVGGDTLCQLHWSFDEYVRPPAPYPRRELVEPGSAGNAVANAEGPVPGWFDLLARVVAARLEVRSPLWAHAQDDRDGLPSFERAEAASEVHARVETVGPREIARDGADVRHPREVKLAEGSAELAVGDEEPDAAERGKRERLNFAAARDLALPVRVVDADGLLCSEGSADDGKNVGVGWLRCDPTEVPLSGDVLRLERVRPSGSAGVIREGINSIEERAEASTQWSFERGARKRSSGSLSSDGESEDRLLIEPFENDATPLILGSEVESLGTTAARVGAISNGHPCSAQFVEESAHLAGADVEPVCGLVAGEYTASVEEAPEGFGGARERFIHGYFLEKRSSYGTATEVRSQMRRLYSTGKSYQPNPVDVLGVAPARVGRADLEPLWRVRAPHYQRRSPVIGRSLCDALPESLADTLAETPHENAGCDFRHPLCKGTTLAGCCSFENNDSHGRSNQSVAGPSGVQSTNGSPPSSPSKSGRSP